MYHSRHFMRLVCSFAVLAWARVRTPSVHPETLARRLAALPVLGLPVERPVLIRWNKHQVPWIEADSDRDCAVALGVVHAHLRLGQMEVMRRIAYGRTAEMLGPAAISVDRFLRTLSLTRAIPGILTMLPERTRAWLEGFTAGINHVVAKAEELPPESGLLALGREPWTPADVLALGRLVAADINWLIWFRLWHLHRTSEWRGLWERVLAYGAGPIGHAGTSGIAAALLAPAAHGSNAWAVAMQASATGAPLLACDPHVPVAIPNAWMLAAFRSPSFQVCGLMLPGLPFVAAGRNLWLAWGGTALHAASSDLFDLSAVPDESFDTRAETIKVRGARPVTVSVRTSGFGPVISDAMDMGGTYALRWVGHDPSDELSAMLGINAARDFVEFRAAADGFAVPGQTFIVAEASGSVAKQIAVKLPRRPGIAAGYPAVPPGDIQHWQRFATASAFAAERNPACGFAVSANDRPHETPVPVGFLFSPADRFERISAVLSATQPVSPAGSEDLQRDIALPSACRMRDRLLAVIGPGSAHSPALTHLKDWDGTYGQDSRGALTFELLIAHFCRCYYSRTERAFHAVLWTSRDLMDADLAADGARLRATLRRALQKTDRDLGRFATWGDIHRLVLAHPLASLPFIGRGFVFADLPAAGASDTIMKTASPAVPGRQRVGYGSVARLTADLSGTDETRAVLLGGQDGWLGSGTMLDQLDLWRKGRSIRLPLDPKTARHEFPYMTWFQPDKI